jgi:hypothetical protein
MPKEGDQRSPVGPVELQSNYAIGALPEHRARCSLGPLRITGTRSFWPGPAGAYLRDVDGDLREVVRGEVKRRLALQSEDAPFSSAARAWAVRGIVPTRL